MSRLFGFILAVLSMATSLPAPAFALTPAQHGEIARLALEKHIRPGYALLANAASELENGMLDYCARPTPAGRKNIEQNFAKTLLAWSRIEHIHFGPIAQNNRASRLVFWPDHKNIGLRQIKKALSKQNKDVLDVQKLQNKSVALQGLAALEVLLYGKGNEQLGDGSKEAQFRCSYAIAISRNLATISAQVVQGWRDDSKFVQIFLSPDKGNELYQTPKEVTLALFLSLSTELKLVHSLKLGRPLGKTAQKARPKRAAFWRSKQTFAVIDANLAGVRALFDKIFSSLIANSDPGAEEAIELDFEQVHRDLMEINLPIGQAVRDERARAKLKNLLTTIDQINKDAGAAITKAANLSMGFNALDGD